MAAKRTDQAFAVEVPRLLEEHGMSLRQLAGAVDVQPSHLSRLLRGADYRKTPSSDLMGKVAMAFGLPTDYFAEYREAAVVEAVRRDPELRERIYRRL
ncbi:MAG TPA: helix-turn-helix transcriptional regulator [Solirubrobacteraceae bacterium]|jgi:transcriptional regulator with XRE-family HTH domain